MHWNLFVLKLQCWLTGSPHSPPLLHRRYSWQELIEHSCWSLCVYIWKETGAVEKKYWCGITQISNSRHASKSTTRSHSAHTRHGCCSQQHCHYTVATWYSSFNSCITIKIAWITHAYIGLLSKFMLQEWLFEHWPKRSNSLKVVYCIIPLQILLETRIHISWCGTSSPLAPISCVCWHEHQIFIWKRLYCYKMMMIPTNLTSKQRHVLPIYLHPHSDL